MLLIFLAITCYITLELLVGSKQFYNAGVDNVLMCAIITFTVSALLISDQDSWLVISSTIMVIAAWLSIRFADAFMAVVSYCCSLVFIFLAYSKAGEFAKATVPLLMMAVSALIYSLMKKLIYQQTFVYRLCFKAVTFLTLVTFYAGGNYFIVKELSNQMFHLQLGLNDSIPPGWLFWVFTFMIPVGYIVYGTIKKDLLVMRTGLALIAATIFTVKYYYNILPVEIEMLIAGAILIAVSYALIKYLTAAKHGYTSENIYQYNDNLINTEALVIAETFDSKPPVEQQGLYSGGSGGGGGAAGKF